jgi:uncharacterized protein (TIGR03067 family)
MKRAGQRTWSEARRRPDPWPVAVALAALVAVVAVEGGSVPAAPPAAAADRDEDIRRDRHRYAGTWRVVSIEADGKPANDDREIVVVNTEDGGWRLLVDGVQINAGTSSIDPTATPAEIDLEITEGDGTGNTLRGIYAFPADDVRVLCFRGGDGWRPQEFAAPQNSGAILVHFERRPD